MRSRITGIVVLLCATSGLSGCFMDGDSSSYVAAPIQDNPVDPSVPDDRMPTAVAGDIALSMTDELVHLAEFSQDMLRSGERGSRFLSCANGGYVTIELDDADTSASLTAGDLLTVSLRDCSLKAAVYSGSLEVAVVSTVAGLVVTDVVADLEHYYPSSNSWDSVVFTASVDSERTSSRRRIAIRTGSNGMVVSNGALMASELVLRDAVIEKVLDLATARYTLSLSGAIESDQVGSVIRFSTPSVFSGYADTYPDEGQLNFSTDQHAGQWRANYLVGNETATFLYRDNISGVLKEEPVGIAWTAIVDGFLWQTGTAGAPLADVLPATKISEGTSFRLLYSYETNDRFDTGTGIMGTQTPSLTYVFSQPLAMNRSVSATFNSQGWPYASSAGIVIASGQTLNVKAAAGALVEGGYYLGIGEVRSASLTEWAYPGALNFWINDEVDEIVTISSTLAPAGTAITLDASASAGIGDAVIESYQWRQVAGTTVTLANADTAVASFTVPPVTGSETLVFEVLITAMSGFQVSQQVSVTAYESADSLILLEYMSDQGDYIGGGQMARFTDQTATFTLSPTAVDRVGLSVITPNYGAWWYLDLDTASGVPLAVGTYTGATRFPFNESSVNGLSFSGSGRGCNTLTGEFTVHDIARDAEGNISRLSVDFTQHCEGGVPALHGRVRYRSAAGGV